jgi:phosphinothricin acetyltransferase
MSQTASPTAIRAATPADAAAIVAIYNYYIAETVVTFEEVPLSTAEMTQRIDDVTRHAGYPWLVHESNGSVDGYAYAASWKSRAAYRYSVESTIYLRRDAAGRGTGVRLYGALIDELRRLEVHNVIGGIALPNAASVALHEKLGFVKIGDFHEVGWKLGQWIDVGYWELILNASFPRPRAAPSFGSPPRP